jgi:dihydrofolate reductase
MLVIIAAVSENNVIGKDGKIPWHISEDFRRFKSLTVGHTVIMGRKTFESLGRPLPERKNIVITHQKNYKPDGVLVAGSFADALRLSSGKVFVIGGSSVYREALPHADILEITKVHKNVDGDVYFPVIGNEWKETKKEDKEGFSFVTYERK